MAGSEQDVASLDDAVAPGSSPERRRVVDWATEAGYLPELIGSKTSAMRPVTVNPKHWLYRAAMLRMKWSSETFVTKQDFDGAIATVGNVTVR